MSTSAEHGGASADDGGASAVPDGVPAVPGEVPEDRSGASAAEAHGGPSTAETDVGPPAAPAISLPAPSRQHGEDPFALPFWRQRGWLLAAGFLAAALALSLLAVVTRGDPPPLLETASAAGPLTKTASDTTGRPAGCTTGDGDGDRAAPEAPPADLRWRTVGGTRVPVSAAAGPTQETGPVLWCFARTPMGAVLAAHVIPAQMTSPDWRAVTRDQVVAGFGRDLFVSQRGSFSDARLKTRRNGTYAGFLLAEYSPAAATVDVLIKSPDGPYFSTSVRLLWSGGDWKIRPANDGGLHTELSSASGTDGFVLWKV
ncbi:hypothetical protein OHU34_40985 [Streptomyces sp. NBC_00080]|uniref:hypothetical protein n=1 Tax=unclassified Streptomyces TaxID=2593676 RepID=UPI001175ADF9|nr:hypothetical protein [Streptomyces sp. SLBN-115]TQJ46540.1 hypothetical protein FBY34_5936 [Streptomyces sp. SLBN-115]